MDEMTIGVDGLVPTHVKAVGHAIHHRLPKACRPMRANTKLV
jgi:hypothetical protein